jgi:hypothetical protein
LYGDIEEAVTDTSIALDTRANGMDSGLDSNAAGLLSIDFIAASQTPSSCVEEKGYIEVEPLFLAFQINKSGLRILEGK